ncbi:hypothetical protein HHI36_012984 [Cryptolaemus montrouzieri]|uniref:Uncharacterized protein n=1 Tax=Cryptolaemus montrouzieri TaxID=559131 RepID=A0ABD2NGE0_9CUCU
MKKNREKNHPKKNSPIQSDCPKDKEEPIKIESPSEDLVDSDNEQTFSNWLSSSQGTENLKLFVLGNSLLLFLAITWPKIAQATNAIYELYKEYM